MEGVDRMGCGDGARCSEQRLPNNLPAEHPNVGGWQPETALGAEEQVPVKF